jgi:hypothetical protein
MHEQRCSSSLASATVTVQRQPHCTLFDHLEEVLMRALKSLSMILLVIPLIGLAQETSSLPEHFTAAAVGIGGPRTRPVATNVEIAINRWSTRDETQRLMQALQGEGSDALLEVLKDLRSVGTIRTPGNLAYDLRYAHQVSTGDGRRRIFLATDRPISVWEAINRPRTIDYPFTFIELRVNARGEGEGKLSLATRIISSSDGQTIELENYDTQPIQLSGIRRQ